MSTRQDPVTPPEEPVTGQFFCESDYSVTTPYHWKRQLVQTSYPYLLVLADLALLIALYFSLWLLRQEEFGAKFVSQRMLIAITIPTLIGNYLVGGYNYATQKNRFRYLAEHAIVSALVFATVLILIYAIVAYGRPIHTSRYVVFGTMAGFPILAIAYRWLLGNVQEQHETSNAICIIGANADAKDLYGRLKKSGITHEVLVFSHRDDEIGNRLKEDDPESPEIAPLSTLQLSSSIDGHFVEAYVLAVDPKELPRNLRQALVVSLFNRNQIFSFESFVADKLKLFPPSHLSLDWPLEPGFNMHRSRTFYRTKLLFDRIVALTGIIVGLPILLLVALAVKLTSRGPVIFTQERTGLQEEPFSIYKFRSMRVGSEKGSKYTEANDPRLTPIGKFLRATRLDETPQLFNVLKGDLSLIGPRAEWVDLVKNYESKFPCYHFRHAVRPGITGWAQVNYPYGASEKDTLEKLGYDLYYVKNCSFMLDVTIIVKTIYTVVFGRGQ